MRKKLLSLLLACSVVMSGNVYSTSVQVNASEQASNDDDADYVALSQTKMDNCYAKPVLVDFNVNATDASGTRLYEGATYKRYDSKKAYDKGKAATGSGNLSSSSKLATNGYYVCRIVYNDGSSSVVNKRFTVDTKKPVISVSGINDSNGLHLATGNVKFNVTDANINCVRVNQSTIGVADDSGVITAKDFEITSKEEEYNAGYKHDDTGKPVPNKKIRHKFTLSASVKGKVEKEGADGKSTWETAWVTKTIKSWTSVSEDTTCKIIAIDKASNQSSVTITWDSVKPEIKGVTANHYYNSNKTCNASDKNLWHIQVKKGGKYYYYTKAKDSKLKTTEEEGKYYWYRAKAKFAKETKETTKTFGKKSFTTKGDGKYTMIAEDKAGNKRSVKFYIDTTKPEIKGVKSGKSYSDSVSVTISDKMSGVAVATIDGKNVRDGDGNITRTITGLGSHTIRVKDNAGNWNFVVFRING